MSGGGATVDGDRAILRPWRRLMVFSEAIKFEHSVFALPFAVVAALMAMERQQDWVGLGWVVVAMVAMRTFGMGSNRVIDAEIDSRNPRTSGQGVARRPAISPGDVGLHGRLARRVRTGRVPTRTPGVATCSSPGTGNARVPVPEAVHLAQPFRPRNYLPDSPAGRLDRRDRRTAGRNHLDGARRR